jgi:hypothetical protein
MKKLTIEIAPLEFRTSGFTISINGKRRITVAIIPIKELRPQSKRPVVFRMRRPKRFEPFFDITMFNRMLSIGW